ncbi:MAG: PTS lactose/cellobiose transporter subunit IIA [Selenomonas ruminantium]|nr:PTS lactose/cellobiose transporter subunit IIA [Selenomonas ruminantium]
MRMEASRELLLQKMLKAANDARLSYLKAIHAARNKDFDKAKNLLEIGDGYADIGHEIHTSLMQEILSLSGQELLLLIHAEDQLTGAEGNKALAVESIHIYQAMQSTQSNVGSHAV